MIAYRICQTIFSDDISGTGAKLFGGRWNSKGVSALYVTEHISLAVLEMLVHVHFEEIDTDMSMLHIALPETAEVKELKLAKLKADWTADYGYTQFIGDEFIRAGKNLLMKIPSAVVTEEHNFIINPMHADFKKIKVAAVRTFETDRRLFTI